MTEQLNYELNLFSSLHFGLKSATWSSEKLSIEMSNKIPLQLFGHKEVYNQKTLYEQLLIFCVKNLLVRFLKKILILSTPHNKTNIKFLISECKKVTFFDDATKVVLKAYSVSKDMKEKTFSNEQIEKVLALSFYNSCKTLLASINWHSFSEKGMFLSWFVRGIAESLRDKRLKGSGELEESDKILLDFCIEIEKLLEEMRTKTMNPYKNTCTPKYSVLTWTIIIFVTLAFLSLPFYAMTILIWNFLVTGKFTDLLWQTTICLVVGVWISMFTGLSTLRDSSLKDLADEDELPDLSEDAQIL